MQIVHAASQRGWCELQPSNPRVSYDLIEGVIRIIPAATKCSRRFPFPPLCLVSQVGQTTFPSLNFPWNLKVSGPRNLTPVRKVCPPISLLPLGGFPFEPEGNHPHHHDQQNRSKEGNEEFFISD